MNTNDLCNLHFSTWRIYFFVISLTDTFLGEDRQKVYKYSGRIKIVIYIAGNLDR